MDLDYTSVLLLLDLCTTVNTTDQCTTLTQTVSRLAFAWQVAQWAEQATC